RIAVLLAATVFAAPHSSLADMVLLAAAAALWAGEAAATRGTPLALWTLALAVWIAALINPPIVSPIGRLTPLLVTGFVAMLFAARLRVLAVQRQPRRGAASARLAVEE